MNATDLLNLASHGPDTYMGAGPHYPWGGLYGGQIVAQSLRAAAATVDREVVPHSLRAYFIRRGDHNEPVRYEVDRIRDGTSFCTRRVVARQTGGIILNLEASFQRPEPSIDIESVQMLAGLPDPDSLISDQWTPLFDRRLIPLDQVQLPPSATAGRILVWMKAADVLGAEQLVHQCMLAFISDDLPGDAVVRTHPIGRETDDVRRENMFLASLDHSMWFHRPLQADQWHVFDFACQSFVGGRGLAIGHVFAQDGTHVSTVAQEVVMRDRRDRSLRS